MFSRRCIFLIIILVQLCLPIMAAKKTVFNGLCYGPHRQKGQNPITGPHPYKSQISDDLKILKPHTSRLRLYSAKPPFDTLAALAQSYGFECLPGSWVSGDETTNLKELEFLIRLSERLKLSKIVLGNEVLLRGDLTEEEFIKLFRRAKRLTRAKVGTADSWKVWLEHPRLAKEADFLLIHIHPYWESVDAGKAADYVISRYRKVCAAYPDKKIIIGETGWPHGGQILGRSVPSSANQRRFIKEFVAKADKARIPYYLFEAFDEPWKAVFEGSVGDKWGIKQVFKD